MVTKKYLEMRLGSIGDDLESHAVSIGADMDILSRRICNGFAYVTTIMEEHEARFHAKSAPKKVVKKNFYNKKHTPEKLNKLIETIRKA